MANTISTYQTFGEIALLSAGGPAYATTNITYYIFVKGFNSFDLGAASAFGVIALVLTIALIMPTFSHYTGVLDAGFVPYAVNSAVVVLVSTLVVLVLAVPAAFALSLAPVPKSQDVLFFFISTKMMPIAAGIIPIYVIANYLGLLDSIPLLVTLHIGMNLPLGIWMIRSFMQDIPKEILEAAQLTARRGGGACGRSSCPLFAPVLQRPPYCVGCSLGTSTSTR